MTLPAAHVWLSHEGAEPGSPLAALPGRSVSLHEAVHALTDRPGYLHAIAKFALVDDLRWRPFL